MSHAVDQYRYSLASQHRASTSPPQAAAASVHHLWPHHRSIFVIDSRSFVLTRNYRRTEMAGPRGGTHRGISVVLVEERWSGGQPSAAVLPLLSPATLTNEQTNSMLKSAVAEAVFLSSSDVCCRPYTTVRRIYGETTRLAFHMWRCEHEVELRGWCGR